MTFIDEKWLRRAHQALAEMFAVNDKTRDEMIQFLFDEGFWDPEKLSWEGALAKWRANLNPSKGEFWKISEVWALGLRFRRHHLLRAMADSLGYEIREVPTEVRKQELMERAVELLEEMEAARAELLAELARLTATPVREHLATPPGVRPSFSQRDPTPVELIGAP